MEFALGIFCADVLPVTVWFSCLSHLQTLNIKQVNVNLGYVYIQTDRAEEIIHVCMYVCMSVQYVCICSYIMYVCM